jgi:hypothetical protein
MLIELDTELFPDRCEVVEMPLHNQFVYLIQKNGYSSLQKEIQVNAYKVFANDEIKQLSVVDVYLRDPQTRYVSGVNTYLQHLMRDHPELDQFTAFWFAKRYKFLNIHYLPQFHWLVNLSQYLNDNTKLQFHNINSLSQITEYHFTPPGVTSVSTEFTEKLLDNNNIKLWVYLDQILLELQNKQLTWHEVIAHYRKNHNQVFDLICGPLLKLSNQLNVLPKT